MIFGKDKQKLVDLIMQNEALKVANTSLIKQNNSLDKINKSLEEEVDSLKDVAYKTVKIPRKNKINKK